MGTRETEGRELTAPLNRPCVPIRAAQPCLNRGLNGLRDCADYPHRPAAIDLSPRPPFLRGKGERMAFLKVCIHGCFDGFGRMDHAMNPKKPLAIPLAKPLTVPPSSQEGG